MPDQFLLLLKPASRDCNLECRYCFYHPYAECGRAAEHMSLETLSVLTRKYMAEPVPRHIFAWQGGEPTLTGLDFFRRALDMQEGYSNGDAAVNVLQTNGTLLDDEWGDFLHEKHILTGISVDGPESIHDRFRRHAGGSGSFSEVMRGAGILKKHCVDFNVLTLVSASNQSHPLDVYDFLREHGLNYQQYIECVEFDPAGKRMPFALAEGKWGEFLCAVFDEWYKNDTGTVSIRLFDSILSRLTNGSPTLCQMSGCCDSYLVMEADGSVYPCDFYVRSEHRLGNILSDSLAELRIKQRGSKHFSLKSGITRECMECKWRPLCMGDCPRIRQNSHSVLCADWRMFYDRFEVLASRIDARGGKTR